MRCFYLIREYTACNILFLIQRLSAMRFTTTLINSLALALPFLYLITAEDFCVSGQFRLRIYKKECEGLSVKTIVDGEENDVHQTECGDAWGTEKDGIDGFPVVGDVTIERANIRDSSTRFWFNQGPRDHALATNTEVSPVHVQRDMRTD